MIYLKYILCKIHSVLGIANISWAAIICHALSVMGDKNKGDYSCFLEVQSSTKRRIVKCFGKHNNRDIHLVY